MLKIRQRNAKYPNLWKDLWGFWCFSKLFPIGLDAANNYINDLSVYNNIAITSSITLSKYITAKYGMRVNLSGAVCFASVLGKADGAQVITPWATAQKEISVVTRFSFTSTAGMGLVGKDNAGSGRSWCMFASGGAIYFWCFGTGGTLTQGYVSSVNDGKEHHFVGIFSVNNPTIIKIYIDGERKTVSYASTNFSGTQINNVTNPVTIGALGIANYQYTGTLGDVLVYNREITPQEVSLLYQNKIWERQERFYYKIFTAPLAPGNVIATAGNGKNTLTWDASVDATSYNLYWLNTSPVTQLTGTKITGVTSPYQHLSLTNGIPYYYVVTAVNGFGESADSSEVNATPTGAVLGTWTSPIIMPKKKQTVFPDDYAWSSGTHNDTEVNANNQVTIID